MQGHSILLNSAHVELNHDWGLDHGTWKIIRQVYPKAKVPVLQMSIDFTKAPRYHHDVAKEPFALRKKGVPIIGSGNMVHGLRMPAWNKMDEPGYGNDRAPKLNDQFKKIIMEANHQPLINYQSLGAESSLAIPTPERYLPLLYALGLKSKKTKFLFSMIKQLRAH
mgnify:CR=1 FL=1